MFERLQEAALDRVSKGLYAEALPMLEVRLSAPEAPVVLLTTYVLCLGRTGRADQARVAAAKALKVISALAESPQKKQLEKLLAESIRAGASVPAVPAGRRPGPMTFDAASKDYI